MFNRLSIPPRFLLPLVTVCAIWPCAPAAESVGWRLWSAPPAELPPPTPGPGAYDIPGLLLAEQEALSERFRRRTALPFAGMHIHWVGKGSFAEAAGIQAGEILTAIGGQPLCCQEEFDILFKQQGLREAEFADPTGARRTFTVEGDRIGIWCNRWLNPLGACAADDLTADVGRALALADRECWRDPALARAAAIWAWHNGARGNWHARLQLAFTALSNGREEEGWHQLVLCQHERPQSTAVYRECQEILKAALQYERHEDLITISFKGKELYNPKEFDNCTAYRDQLRRIAPLDRLPSQMPDARSGLNLFDYAHMEGDGLAWWLTRHMRKRGHARMHSYGGPGVGMALLGPRIRNGYLRMRFTAERKAMKAQKRDSLIGVILSSHRNYFHMDVAAHDRALVFTAVRWDHGANAGVPDCRGRFNGEQETTLELFRRGPWMEMHVDGIRRALVFDPFYKPTHTFAWGMKLSGAAIDVREFVAIDYDRQTDTAEHHREIHHLINDRYWAWLGKELAATDDPELTQTRELVAERLPIERVAAHPDSEVFIGAALINASLGRQDALTALAQSLQGRKLTGKAQRLPMMLTFLQQQPWQAPAKRADRKPFTGWVKKYKARIKGFKAGDKLVGPATLCDRQAQLKAKGFFASDQRYGPWAYFHANGNKASEGVLSSGRKIGEWSFYHTDGSLHERGEMAETTPDDGRRHGPWTGRYSDGTPQYQGGYRAGQRHGTWTWYHADGGRARQGDYELGTPTGTWRAWNLAGDELAEAEPGPPKEPEVPQLTEEEQGADSF